MCRPIFLFTCLAFQVALMGCTQPGQDMTPAEILLAQSIAYHDPDGIFMKRSHRFALRETRPNKSDRHTTIVLDGHGTGLTLEQQRDGHFIEAAIDPDGCRASLDGTQTIPDSLAKRYRLTCEGLAWVRDYYGFLYALPMKLTEPGTRLHPAVTDTTYQGDAVQMLRVSFDSEVGTDSWWFFLDPGTHALVGYRFIHHDRPETGEFVVMEGEVTASGVRLPHTRHWYTNADGEYLGADVVEQYETIR